MSKKVTSIIILFLFWFIFLMLGLNQLHLEFSKSPFRSSDLINILPITAWIYLICLAVGTLFIIRFADSRVSYFIPFVLISILLIVFPLAQFPCVNHWDTFSHATDVEYISAYGHFSVGRGSYAKIYPAAFALSAIFSQITGIPVLSAHLTLASFLTIMICFVLLVIGRSLIAKEKSWLVPMAYFAFSFKYFLNYHYSPQLMGLTIFISIIYLILKTTTLDSRAWKVSLTLLLLALITTHAFSAMTTVVVFIFMWIIFKLSRVIKFKHKQLTSSFALLGIVLFVGWTIFISTEHFSQAIEFLSLLIKGKEPVVILGMPFQWPGPFLPMLQFYRYTVYAFFTVLAVWALFKFWRRIEIRILFVTACGITLGSYSLAFTPYRFGIERFLYFIGVVISVLFSYSVVTHFNARQGKKKSLNVKYVIPLLVIGTFLVSNLYGSIYVYYMHPDEINAADFMCRKTIGSISAIIDDACLIKYFSWSNENMQMLIIVDDRDPFDVAATKFETADFSLQYLPRQTFYFNSSFMESRGNLIYSNNLARIYAKFH